MGGRRPAPGTGAAGLHHHDGLVPGDAPGGPGEPAGVGHRFQVGQNKVGGGVLIPIQQQVVGGQVGGVADRHEAADPERRTGEQGECGQPEPAGLGHERQAARRGEVEAERGVEPRIGAAVEQPHAVGPDEPHPGDPGAAAQLILQGPAVAADLGETGRDHAHRTDPQAAGLVDDPGHQRRGHRHHRQVRRLRAAGQVRVGGHALDDLMAGVDRVHRPSETAGEQVGQQQPADAGGLAAGPHQGDGSGAQERCDRGPGRGALTGQHRIKIGIGFLHREAGVHARRRHLLRILQAKVLQQAQHRRIAPGHVAGQPADPGVPGRLSQPAHQQSAQPGTAPGGINEDQEPGRLPGHAVIPRHPHHPPRRAARHGGHHPGRVARPRDGHLTRAVGRQMSQAGEPLPGGSIQAAPQRPDPRRIPSTQRANRNHPAVPQRLLRTRNGGGGHGRPRDRP